jgi:hypothetical protein
MSSDSQVKMQEMALGRVGSALKYISVCVIIVNYEM